MTNDFQSTIGMMQTQKEEALRQALDLALQEKYGVNPDAAILQRVKEEWHAMERCGVMLDVAALYEWTSWLRGQRIPFWLRGSAGSSFIFYLLEITRGNPLPSHGYCSVCKSVFWQPMQKDGFDLPRNLACPRDGATLLPDGHGIPWQILFGYDEFTPTFEVDLLREIYRDVKMSWKNHWLHQFDELSEYVPPLRGAPPTICCSHLRLRFCLHETVIPLKRETDMDHTAPLRQWRSLIPEPPEWLEAALPPETIADLLSCMGMDYGDGWRSEALRCMVGTLGYAPSDAMVFQDDVYVYLIDHGFLEKDAWKAVASLRRGNHLPVVTEEMRRARDQWVVRQCEEITYLAPKAHVTEKMLFHQLWMDLT